MAAAAPGASVPQTEVPAEAHDASKGPRVRHRGALAIAAIVVVALAVLAFWLHARHFEDTDDAQIDGNISTIAPRVTGPVVAVHVVENQIVHAGDLLAELDTRDLQVAVDLAKAQTAEAEAQLEAEDPSVPITETTNRTMVATTSFDSASARASLLQSRKSVGQLEAQVAQTEATDKQAQLERARAQELIDQKAISRSEYDQRVAAADASAASVAAMREALEAARAAVGEQEARVPWSATRADEAKANAPRQLATRHASVVYRQALVDAAKAQLAQAELNLSYAKVVAPVSGIVGKKSVNVGDYVTPGQPLFAITQTDDLWVTANFRETQLRRMSAGQTVDVHVDVLGEDLRGTVESIGGATGSRYSVLPPENASGNYVKVVQRVPVRVAIERGQSGMDRLRPGMSVEPRVRIF